MWKITVHYTKKMKKVKSNMVIGNQGLNIIWSTKAKVK